jgi:hypothetical protein
MERLEWQRLNCKSFEFGVRGAQSFVGRLASAAGGSHLYRPQRLVTRMFKLNYLGG